MNNALVVNLNDWWQIFKHRENHSLDKIDIHNYHYIVGPYFIKNCHWVAVIINIQTQTFQVIDPKGDSAALSQQCKDSWVQYYNRRHDIKIEKWNNNTKIQHPVQTTQDNHNCGVFVCLLIEHYAKENGTINFKSGKKDLKMFRDQIAKTLENNKA